MSTPTRMPLPFFSILFDSLRGARRTGTRDTAALIGVGEGAASRRLLIVGSPNVGKSVLFNRLTGRYVVVSNYPGTTVEVSRGKAWIGDTLFEVVDTPGMYSLCPLSEEERVGRALLLREPADVVLHVVDAKNLERMLAFTHQLIEAGFPVILVVNMMDEAQRLGLGVDLQRLGDRLGIPVVGTVAVTGRGLQEVKTLVSRYVVARSPAVVAS